MSPPTRFPLRDCRIRNFKAVRDSGLLRFGALTAFIGNNGSGKSSVIEALEALKTLVLDGADAAMRPWHGVEHAWNKAAQRTGARKGRTSAECPKGISVYVSGQSGNDRLRARVILEAEDEHFDRVTGHYLSTVVPGKLAEMPSLLRPDLSVEDPRLIQMVMGWQFLSLAPREMTEPRLKRRAGGRPVLARDGSNLAEYLQSIYDGGDEGRAAFGGIVDAMRAVLPYAEDLRPRVTTGVEKKVYLELAERGFRERLPSWLFSTGTVRILALLAVLRHPQPPSVLFVEEIENGLDPQTIHLLVEEIRAFVQSGTGQVVVTTHSPYLLDLLPLSSLILAERDAGGAPMFSRPADRASLAEWAKSFAPGKLYTMGGLSGGGASQ